MVAAALDVPGKDVVRQALEAGFLMNCTQEKVLRFLPPLIIERQHVDELIGAYGPFWQSVIPGGAEGGSRMSTVMATVEATEKLECTRPDLGA